MGSSRPTRPTSSRITPTMFTFTPGIALPETASHKIAPAAIRKRAVPLLNARRWSRSPARRPRAAERAHRFTQAMTPMTDSSQRNESGAASGQATAGSGAALSAYAPRTLATTDASSPGAAGPARAAGGRTGGGRRGRRGCELPARRGFRYAWRQWPLCPLGRLSGRRSGWPERWPGQLTAPAPRPRWQPGPRHLLLAAWQGRDAETSPADRGGHQPRWPRAGKGSG